MQFRRRRVDWLRGTAWAALATLALMVGGCGGGGGGGGPSLPATIGVTCDAVTGMCGWVGSAGDVHRGIRPDVGDDFLNRSRRGFYRFDISAIPAGATIVQATLRTELVAAHGTPFTDLGSLWINHVECGPSLDASDFDRTPITPALAFVTSTGLGPLNVPVTAGVQADVRIGWPHCDFRLEFSRRTDGAFDTDFLQLRQVLLPDDVQLVVSYIP
ncbi:MAG: hypothetical protein QNJ98_09500 [Planctomycetota bacterium]|nr:hypothetical protein [Planctomycetota bacterium]